LWPIDCYYRPGLNIVDSDLETIRSLAEGIPAGGRRFFWTGYRAGEILGTARMLHHGVGRGAEIYMADFPNIPVKRHDGVTLYPDCLAMTAQEQVKEIACRFRRVQEDELPRWSDIWREALSDGAVLRILDGEGKISGVDISGFDQFLERRCAGDFQKAARVIGYTLCDLFDLGWPVGDS
jgi:hypothetical protein